MWFFIQWQGFKVGFSNVSKICIKQARNQIFLGQGEIFVELGYFDKHPLKTHKKAPCRKVLEIFLLYSFKTTFWI